MTTPGIYRNMPFADYQAIDAHNPSSVLKMAVSAKHYDYFRTHPQTETAPMRLGTAIHCAVLEPGQFAIRYGWWDGARRGKAYNDFCDENEGKAILSRTEFDQCLVIRRSIRAHPVAGPLLDGPFSTPDRAEVSIVWNDRQTGLKCKSRIDLILPGVIVDLKTVGYSLADDYAIRRNATKLGWHISMGARQDGIDTLSGEVPECKLILVEQKPPHDVRVMNIDDAVLSQGQDKWYALLERVKDCERTGHWPGCSETETNLNVWLDDIE